MTKLPTRPKGTRKRATPREVMAAMKRVRAGEPIAVVSQATGIAYSALYRRKVGKLKAHRERARRLAAAEIGGQPRTLAQVKTPRLTRFLERPAPNAFCTNCGVKTAPEWRYCGGCGSPRMETDR